jgi:hypothetical protein
MESLFDILSNRVPDEPAEIKLIKAYIRKHFQEHAGVAIRDRDIIITVRSSALAATLRARTPTLMRELNVVPGATQKRLVLRIGQPPVS